MRDPRLLEAYKDQGVSMERGIRSALAEKERDIWNQKYKPTRRPTVRWVFMIFEDMLLLYTKRGQAIDKQAMNLRDEHRIGLEGFRSE